MDSFDRRLCLSGMLLFFVGLLLGFVVPAYAPTHGMLAAHLNAVQCGTFLLVLALLWPKLPLGRMSKWLAHLTWISFWLVQVGVTLAAQAQKNADPSLKPLILALNVLGALGMTVAVAIVLVALLRRR
jgi:hypothetical protein